MRIYSLIIFFLFIARLQGQTITNTVNTDPYFECLKLYLSSLIEMGIYTTGDTAYVSHRDYSSDYTGSYHDVFIKMVNNELLFELTKKKRAIRVLVINPLEFKDGYATINVVNFGTSRKRKHYTLINNGFNRIKVGFDCKVGKYEYEVVDSH